MNFKCDTQIIKSACASASKASSVKATIPTLKGLLLEAKENCLTITGYDLQLGIKKSITAEVSDTGAIIVDATMLNNILSKVKGNTVEFALENNNLVRIKSGRARFKINGINAEDFPEIPAVTGENFSLTEKDFLKMISVPIFAAADECQQKPISTGLNFELSDGCLTTYALDGYRLALYRLFNDFVGSYSFTVPKRTIKCISKEISDSEEKIVNITLSSNHIHIVTDEYDFFSRLLEGERFDYKNAIPNKFVFETIIDVDSTAESINCCAPIIESSQKNPIRCEFDGNQLNIKTKSVLGEVEDTIDIETTMQETPVTIGFNAKYLLEALNNIPPEHSKVTYKLAGPVSPSVIVPNKDDDSNEKFLFMVLPMRLKN
jgi:DNA polymerase-3 subunit beta